MGKRFLAKKYPGTLCFLPLTIMQVVLYSKWDLQIYSTHKGSLAKQKGQGSFASWCRNKIEDFRET